MATTANPDQQTFEQWITSLQKLIQKDVPQQQKHQQPYKILIEYSQSWSLRTMETNATEDRTYTRAGLRTPTMNAQRDTWGGPLWVEFLVQSLRCESVDWLGTVPWTAGRRQRLEQQQQHYPTNIIIRTIDTLDEATAPVLVVESTAMHLSKLLLRSNNNNNNTSAAILLHPLRTDTVPPLLLRQWEDAADAILHVQNGHVTLLRRGVRESGQWIRATLAAYHRDERSSSSIVWDDPTDTAAVVDQATTTTTESPPDTAASAKNTSTRRIALEWQDGARQQQQQQQRSTDGKQPRITVDDDDPAFDDYDAEDPDDDLDL